MKSIIFLLIGVIIGAGAILFLITEQPEDDGLEAKMEALELRAEDIQQELAEQGEVVRRKAREVSDEALDTADDVRITATVEARLASDSELSVFDISASTSEGRVTLTGSVESPEHVGRATALALPALPDLLSYS